MANGSDARGVLGAYLIASAAFAYAGFFPVNNADTFGHLAQGRQIVALGHVPQRDLFSFWRPAPAPWHNYEWLSDLALFRVYQRAGFDGLIACKCLLLALSAALLVGYARRSAGAHAAWTCALLLVIAIPGVRFRFTERPHLIAVPLAALYMYGYAYLSRASGKPTRARDGAVIGGLFALHVLWVNLHGSHLLGLVLTGVQLVFVLPVAGARGRLAAVLGLQLAASCISPFGPAILTDALEHVFDPQYRVLVSEWEPWQPSDPLWLMLAPVLQTCLLAAAARPLLRRGVVGRALLASSLLLALLAFRSIRFVDAYLLLSAPALAIGASDLFAPLARARFSAVLGVAFVAAALLAPWAALRLPPFARPGAGVSYAGLPAASGVWLAEHAPQPRVLAAIEDSWYLMFAVPAARFLVDGRVPFYGAAHIQHVRAAFASAPRLLELLARDRVDSVVVRYSFKPQQTLLAALRAHPDFSLVALEDRYAVFVHNGMRLRDGGAPRALGLEPSYELGWLLAANPDQERAILAELARLPAHANVDGYRGFVRAIFALRPLLREGGGHGIRPPASALEREALTRAQAWLARAAQGAEAVPVLHAYAALAALALCRLDLAQAALENARWEGESRETLLGGQELALRRGQRESVRAFLQSAAAMPGAADDGWLRALRKSLDGPPLCPEARR